MDKTPEASPTGGIPQSQALAEASPDSLSELFSRDPEGLQQQDLVKIVTVLREQRAKFAAAEALKAASPGEKKKTSKAASLVAQINPEGLDL